MANQPPPPAKGMTRTQYYGMLVSQGMDPAAAYANMQQQFGPPKSADDIAGDEQKAAFAQLGGALVGTIGLPYLINNAGGWLGLSGAGGGAAGAGGAAGGGAAAGAGGAYSGGAGGMAGMGEALGAGSSATEAGSLAAAGPYAAAVIAAIAAGYNLNRWSKKGKTYGAGEGLREAAKDPLNYLIPSGFIGAAFGDKDMYLKEHRRLLGLQKDGINIPESLVENTRLNKGRSTEELVQIEKDKIAAGKYGNEEFAKTRDAKLLRPEDIWGYSTFFEKYGNDWLGKFTEKQRKEIAQKALDSGAVKEHHGTIDIDWAKVDAPKLPNQTPVPKKPMTIRENLNFRSK